MNSTIVGQRKPKANKRKKKKRTLERRYSEGEASDYESKSSDTIDNCNGNCRTNDDKRCKSDGGKSSNVKSASDKSANSLMFDIEI